MLQMWLWPQLFRGQNCYVDSGEIKINIAFFLFLLQLLLFYFLSPWPLIPLQNPSSWEFWRIPQIAFHTVLSGFQKDPIMCPPGIPSDLCYPRLQTFSHMAQVLLSAKQSWEWKVPYVRAEVEQRLLTKYMAEH